MVDSIDQVDIPCGVQQHLDFDAKKFVRLLTFTIPEKGNLGTERSDACGSTQLRRSAKKSGPRLNLHFNEDF
jgi:hypothetical protein